MTTFTDSSSYSIFFKPSLHTITYLIHMTLLELPVMMGLPLFNLLEAPITPYDHLLVWSYPLLSLSL